MRKIAAIALNSLVLMGRDRKVLMLFLLMPMLLIGILGASLGSIMNSGRIAPFTVIMLNEDQPIPLPTGASLHLGQVLETELFGSSEVRELIQLRTESDLAVAKEALLAGEAVAVIQVPATFSTDVLAGERTEVGLFTDPSKPTQVDIVSQILRAFTDEVATGSLAFALTGQQEAASGTLPKLVQTQAGAREVGAMQYYAAGMAVMYMLMSAIQRAKAVLEQREAGILTRILSSPIRPFQLLAGQTLGTALLIAAQFIILLIGTRLIYGVEWGPWLPVLAIGLAFALAAAGISTGMAAIFRDPKEADSAVGLVGMIFGALSGSMMPLYQFPDSLLAVSRFIPNYWALQGFLDQMAGSGASYAWTPVLLLSIIGVAVGALGSWRLATR